MFEGRLEIGGAGGCSWEEKVKDFFNEQLSKPGAIEKVFYIKPLSFTFFLF